MVIIMKAKILIALFCMMACCANAQQAVTKVTHSKAIKTDVVTKGDVTIKTTSVLRRMAEVTSC